MELRGSKTEKNLWEAFAGESQARNKYTYFASKAKKEGYEQISAIFTETANNEKEHANRRPTTFFNPVLETFISSARSNICKISLSVSKPIARNKVVTGNFFFRSM